MNDAFTPLAKRTLTDWLDGWSLSPTPSQHDLIVDGAPVDLHPDGQARWDSPWASAAWDTGVYDAALDGHSLHLDFAAVRDVGGP